MASKTQIKSILGDVGSEEPQLSRDPRRWPEWAHQTWETLEPGRSPRNGKSGDYELVLLTVRQLQALDSEEGRRAASEQAKRLKRRPDARTVQLRAQQAVIAGASEYARRGVRDAFDRELVLVAVSRVATKKSIGKSLVERAGMVARSSDSYKGHVFELMDQRAFNALKRSGGQIMDLCPEHNHKAIDGVIRVGKQTVEEIQDKASGNPAYLARAAKGKVPNNRTLRVPRGKGKVAERAVKGKMRVRESAVSEREVKRALDKGKKTTKASQVGKPGAARATARAGAGAAVVSGTISFACDAKKVHRGEMSKQRAAKRAGLSAAEGATSTVVATAAGTAAAPAVAFTATTLAGSTLVGTTAAATAVTVAAPVAIPLAVGVGVGVVFKHIRRACGESD